MKREIIAATALKLIAKLARVRRGRERRRLGALAGTFATPADFDAALPEEVVAAFEGRDGDAPGR